MSAEASKLAGIRDGAPLPEEEAKALWREFSEHMDANRGDMSGFAKKKGWFSILPEFRGGKAVLIVRTTASAPAPAPVQAPQRPKQKQRPRPGAKGQARPQGGSGQTPTKGKPGVQGGGGKAPPKKRPG